MDARTGQVAGLGGAGAYDLDSRFAARREGTTSAHVARRDSRRDSPGALREAEARRPAEVVAIGVSGQQHGFVPLDAAGEVIRPAKLWCDTSTMDECEIITAKLGGLKKTIAALGNAVLPGFTAPKILWLKRHEPENYRRLATILLPHDYLNFWLTGERVMEYGDASGTALLDVRKRQWSPAAIKAIDPALAAKIKPPLISGR